MHAALQFVGEGRVHCAVALDAAHAGEDGRHKPHAEMRLALAVELGVVARLDMVMAGMKMALVDHGKPLGRECLLQLGFDACLYRHRRLLCPYMGLEHRTEKWIRFSDCSDAQSNLVRHKSATCASDLVICS